MKAHYDHLVINNKDGKALLKAGRGDLVELIVNTFEDDSKENFEKIIQAGIKYFKAYATGKAYGTAELSKIYDAFVNLAFFDVVGYRGY